jgi:hypothetical protein
MKPTTYSFQTLTENHPAIDQIVDWLYQEWGSVQGDSPSSIKEKLLLKCDCPPSQVAMEQTGPVGFIWLNRYQLPSTSDLRFGSMGYTFLQNIEEKESLPHS